jgi:hypothetical protein
VASADEHAGLRHVYEDIASSYFDRHTPLRHLQLNGMDEYTVIILVALFGFLALAALLLIPVYRFLKREEKASAQWTKEALSRRLTERPRRGSDQNTKRDEAHE